MQDCFLTRLFCNWRKKKERYECQKERRESHFPKKNLLATKLTCVLPPPLAMRCNHAPQPCTATMYAAASCHCHRRRRMPHPHGAAACALPAAPTPRSNQRIPSTSSNKSRCRRPPPTAARRPLPPPPATPAMCRNRCICVEQFALRVVHVSVFNSACASALICF